MHNKTWWRARPAAGGTSPYLGQERLRDYVADLKGYVAMVQDGFSGGARGRAYAGTEICGRERTSELETYDSSWWGVTANRWALQGLKLQSRGPAVRRRRVVMPYLTLPSSAGVIVPCPTHARHKVV
jgi:hypothetical protein